MGFELEDGDWRSWATTGKSKEPKTSKAKTTDAHWQHPNDWRHVRPLEKEEPIHVGTGFKLEADRIQTDYGRLADIEFVTDPFPLDGAGVRALDTALDEIQKICDQITPLAGTSHRKGTFVTSAKHGMRKDVLLSDGAAQARLNLQATHGMRLAQIPSVFGTLATPKGDTDDPELTALIQYAVTGETDASTYGDLAGLRRVPERAFRLSMDYFADKLAEKDADVFEGDDSLWGLFTAVIGFVQSMRCVRKAMDSGIKTNLPMMHRNDFATAFGLLSKPQQKVIQVHRQDFIDAVIYGVVGDVGTADLTGHDPAAHRDEPLFLGLQLNKHDRREMLGGKWGSDLELPNMLEGLRMTYNVLPGPMPIATWVAAWLDGNDLMVAGNLKDAYAASRGKPSKPSGALDTLRQKMQEANPKAAKLIDWSRSRVEGKTAHLVFDLKQLSGKQQSVLSNHMRGVGGLGKKTDDRDPSMVLYENRVIAPQVRDLENELTEGAKLPWPVARSTVERYFVGMAHLMDPSLRESVK